MSSDIGSLACSQAHVANAPPTTSELLAEVIDEDLSPEDTRPRSSESVILPGSPSGQTATSRTETKQTVVVLDRPQSVAHSSDRPDSQTSSCTAVQSTGTSDANPAGLVLRNGL